jgi:DNA-binding PadR family transcriptional regulator
VNTRDVILALIRLRPGVSGYELSRQVKRSSNYFNSFSLSRIYPTLAALESDGLVEFEVEKLVGRQDRKRYTITPAGEEYLHELLAKPFTTDYAMDAFQQFVRQLNHLGNEGNDVLRNHLLEGRAVFAEHLEKVRATGMADIEDYVATEDTQRARHIAVWTRVNRIIADELVGRIAWIERFLEDLDSDPVFKDS